MRWKTITTDGLGSCGAALYGLGNRKKQEIDRWSNNRVENNCLPKPRRTEKRDDWSDSTMCQ